MSSAFDTKRTVHPLPRIGVPCVSPSELVRDHVEYSHHRPLTEILAPFVGWAPYRIGVPDAEDAEDAESSARLKGGSTPACPRGVRDLDGFLLANVPLYRDNHHSPDTTERTAPSVATSLHLLESPPVFPIPEQARASAIALRCHFVERVFAHARLRDLFAGGWLPKELVRFHATHKLQLMAHHPAFYRSLGGVAARAGSAPPDELERDYREGFHRALAIPVSRGRHVNALQHAFGMVSGRLTDARRHEFLASVDAYRSGTAPLGVPLALIRQHCVHQDVGWVAQQTYLDPFPKELGESLVTD